MRIPQSRTTVAIAWQLIALKISGSADVRYGDVFYLETRLGRDIGIGRWDGSKPLRSAQQDRFDGVAQPGPVWSLRDENESILVPASVPGAVHLVSAGCFSALLLYNIFQL